MFLDKCTTLEKATEYYKKQYEELGSESHESQLFVWLTSLKSYHNNYQWMNQRLIPTDVIIEDFTAYCPDCKSPHFMFSPDGEPNDFCGNCGQALFWPLKEFNEVE